MVTVNTREVFQGIWYPRGFSPHSEPFQWRIQDFPEEGAPTPEGATYDFAKFSQKLHEIERIWTPSPPLRSATAFAWCTVPQATLGSHLNLRIVMFCDEITDCTKILLFA